ncbi:response regulator [Dehalogenimonas alkenigignens]|uniref:Response regulator with putative antiterminator output domain n=1 Tax=Dehalogenimonas alkenigignens TaxID=1217799 RepID=A0A0W0GIP0_9CHLR|nr:response regulator [Dehalogenimonas alkenigignens]KTB48426.1 Response regulator with putative antiterminator output domain [Dehalogenimonas alkenigignens]PVV85119.1 response regulator [Dehalogenimonas alkenigignens]
MAKARLMVVEDEAITAEDIRSSLEGMGYDVVAVAATGEEALRIAEKLKPDLVLMDIVLKGGHSGIATAGELRRRFSVPAVYLTAYADPATLAQAKLAEPLGFLTKPFNEADLRASVEMALYKAGAEAERQELIRKLQEALDKVKVLSGLIPICASCKQIRNDKGFWQSVENYISEHSGADFTHGICPSCAKKLYPEYFDQLYGKGSGGAPE